MMAGICAIFISSMMMFSADAYFYGITLGAIGVLLLPRKSIVFLSKISKLYAILFILTISCGVLFPFFMTSETPSLTIGIYILWVYLWTLFSEKTHEKYNVL